VELTLQRSSKSSLDEVGDFDHPLREFFGAELLMAALTQQDFALARL
jgi:hypothetical protein